MKLFGRYRRFGTGRIHLFKKLPLPEVPVDPTVPVAFLTPAGNLGIASGSSPYHYTLLASGDDPVFTLEPGSALPAGLTLFDDGVIYGTATGISETVSFTVRIANSRNTVTRVFSITVNAAPVWQTEPELGEVAQGERFQRTLEAQSSNGDLQPYQLIGPMVVSLSAAGNPFGGDPDLPETIAFNSTTGQLDGYYVSQDPDAPIWSTATGNIGIANRAAVVSFALTANPGFGRTIIDYAVVGRRPLPAGLTITESGGVGTIAGTVDLYANDAREAPDTVLPKPTWTTDSGVVAITTTAPGQGAQSIPLAATPNLGSSLTYMLANGSRIPFGLTMAADTGTISGTLDRLANLSQPYEPLDTVSWSTPAGSLGSKQNGTAASITLNVTPTSGSTVSFLVVKGGLPSGTILTTTDASAGVATISGTIDAAPITPPLSVSRTFTFTIRVTDSLGGASDREFTYTVTP